MAPLESRVDTCARFVRETFAGRICFGVGAISALGEELARLGLSRALLIASARRADLLDQVRSAGDGRVGSAWTEVRQHVPVELVDRAAGAVGSGDGLLCVGGGSTIGLGKALALRTGLPLVAVPTTFSGSEMTPVWGLSESGRKQTGRDSRVLPRVVVYDPELLSGLPSSVAAPSLLNAFAHCAEALYSPKADPVTSVLAVEGARLIAASLRTGGSDSARMTDRLLGAHLGGTVFATAGGSVHHALCHYLGGAYGMPHAETHAALLPYVLEARAPSIVPALIALGAVLHVDGPAVPAACWDQAAAAGCETSLAALGLRHRDVAEAATGFAAGGALVDESAAAHILEAAWRGERPVTDRQEKR